MLRFLAQPKHCGKLSALMALVSDRCATLNRTLATNLCPPTFKMLSAWLGGDYSKPLTWTENPSDFFVFGYAHFSERSEPILQRSSAKPYRPNACLQARQVNKRSLLKPVRFPFTPSLVKANVSLYEERNSFQFYAAVDQSHYGTTR